MTESLDQITEYVALLNPAPACMVTEVLSSEASQELAQSVMTTSLSTNRRQLRVVQLAAGAAALTLAVAGTAAAVQALRPAKEQVLVYCNVPSAEGLLAATDNIGPTGDPVKDCSSVWQHTTGDASPPLAAYQDENSNIQVQPADRTAPAGWKPLPTGVVQDPEQILLNEALQDDIDGTFSRCFDAHGATAKATDIVQASGLKTWPVSVHQASVTQWPAPNCWTGFADPRLHTVIVAAGPSLDARSAAIAELARSLRPSLTECWDMETAVERVRSAVSQSGFPQYAKESVQIRQIPIPSAPCTTVHMGDGGSIFTLRGRRG